MKFIFLILSLLASSSFLVMAGGEEDETNEDEEILKKAKMSPFFRPKEKIRSSKSIVKSFDNNFINLTSSDSKEHERVFKNFFEKKDVNLFVGVLTTKVICRVNCPARRPLINNVVFSNNIYDLISCGLRECKRCNPLTNVSPMVKLNEEEKLEQVELHAFVESVDFPEKYSHKNFHFYLKLHKKSLKKYIQMKRVNVLLNNKTKYQIENIKKLNNLITYIRISTPLGIMIACFTQPGDLLCLLEFSDRIMLESEINKLIRKFNARFKEALTENSVLLQTEIYSYFSGDIRRFKTPILEIGSEFQKKVWQELKKIPYGKTSTYQAQAINLNNPNSSRAIANANGMNSLSIIIPCHRVIGKNGHLTGYGGGLERKKYLLEMEKKYAQKPS